MSNNGRSQNKKMKIYTGFSLILRRILTQWDDRVIKYGEDEDFFSGISLINKELEKNNIILFFDHHYAFDALPLGVAIGKHITHPAHVIIPYAVHLEMGLGREGEPSFRYWIRTRAFRWFVKRIIKGNPQISFYPVVREFEQ